MTKIAGHSPGIIVVVGLIGMLMIGLLVVALVLAIWGLIEYSKQRGAFTQGRAQAIWALVLVGAMGLLAGGGFVRAILRSREFPPLAGRSQPGQVLTFDDFNFRFRAPDHPWVSVEATTLNKDSKASFLRRLPESYFIIIAEDVGGTQISSSEQLAAVGKAHLQSAATSSRIISESPLKVNGLDGIFLKHQAQVDSYSIYYEQWFCVTNGFAYQLMGWGRFEDQRRIAGEFQQMFSRFELIDPKRMASSSGSPFATNFSSPRYAYSVKVTNSAWHVFASLKKNYPEAEFGASRGDSCFTVLPVWLRDQPVDLDSLTAALLATMNIEYPNEDLSNRQPVNEGKLDGVQFDFIRNIDETPFRYRLRILRGKGCGYLIAAWTQRQATNADSVLHDAISRVIFPPSATPALFTNVIFTDQEIKNQGYILNQTGLSFFKSENYEKSLPLFRAAADVSKANLNYLQNALLSLSRLKRFKEGLEYLGTQPAEILDKPEIQVFQAFFQSKCSLVDLALTNYAKAFSRGYRDDDDLSDYVDLLLDQHQYDKAHTEVENYLKAGYSADAWLLNVEIYREEKIFPKAISLLKAEHEKSPFNSKITKSLGEICLDADLASEALDYSQELIKNNSTSGSAYYLKARSELKLKWYREAKASLETAAKLSPANENIRSDLDYVSGLLGEGDNSILKNPIEPVSCPVAVTNTPIKTSQDYAKDYGAYYSRWITAVSYLPQKEYKTTDYLLVNVENTTGVEAFSTVQMPFDPLSEDIFVNEVRVTDGTGRTLSVGQVADYYVIDDASDGTANHNKTLNIPVPGLRPGCKLFVTVTRRSTGRLEGFPFFEHWFSHGFPVLESSVFLKGTTNGLNIRTSPGVAVEALPAGCWWRASEPLVSRWEPLQPSASAFLPVLWMADGADTWTGIASNYLASISDRLQFDENFQTSTRQIVEGLPDDNSKIAALSQYVQTNCTYKAIEFGRRARVPNRPAIILANKYGDCKDHAVLLQQMLKAANIPAQLALVCRDGKLLKDMPSLDQFNHMIVRVQGKNGDRFIDATDKGADLTKTVPDGLADYDTLILDPKNPRMATVPAYATNASIMNVQQSVRLLNETDVVVEETMTLTGVHATFLRNFLHGYSPADQQMAMQREMGLADVELSDFKVESLEHPGAPLSLRFSFEIKKQFRRSDDRLSGLVKAGFERYYLTAKPVNKRLSPFENKVPLYLRSKVSIGVPEGFRAEQMPDAIPKLDSRFLMCRRSQQLDRSKLELDFECCQKIGRFDASDYSTYRATMEQALATLEREVCFKAIGR